MKTGEASKETSYALTSLHPQKAGAERLLKLIFNSLAADSMISG